MRKKARTNLTTKARLMHRNRDKRYTHLKKKQEKKTKTKERDYFCTVKLYKVRLKAKNEFISCKWLGRLFHIIPPPYSNDLM